MKVNRMDRRVWVGDLCCGACDNKKCFYTKDYAYGSCLSFFQPDGAETDNNGLHDGIVYKTGKIVYCAECDAKVCKTEEVIF